MTVDDTETSKEFLNPHTNTIEEVLEKLSVTATSGLSAIEVEGRQAKYGLNQLDEAPGTSIWQMVLAQFNNFVVLLLIAAAVISALFNEWIETGAILAIVVLNAFLGVIQERRAEQAMAALKRLSAPEAQVLREGTRKTIPAREVVPGDIVFLEAGNYIPADIRLIEAVNLRIDEAALTGESVPVHKDTVAELDEILPLGDRKNSAYMSTLTTYGRGRGVVVNTGMQTQIGHIAELLQEVEQEATPLQRRLDNLGKVLGWAALGICGLVFLLGWIRGSDLLDMFLLSVSLAIAAVPEGLPAVVTISLALGMREMIRRNALIRRLSSVETLGSATVIGSDKTGTLTQNEMTVTRLWIDGQFINVSGSGYDIEGEFQINGETVNLADYPAVLTALWVGCLNNDADLEIRSENGQKSVRVIGDPTEGALIVAAAKTGTPSELLDRTYPRVHEIPFDSSRKRMVTVHTVADPQPDDISPFYDEEKREWYVIAEKGAPDVVLDLCTHYQQMNDQAVPLDDACRQRILTANDAMTEDALRVLALAYRTTPNLPDEISSETMEFDLIFVGLVGMIDPPRDEVHDALTKAKQAGIRTVMITGDYPNTARAIARSIGLLEPGYTVMTGNELNQIDDAELQEAVKTTGVFARVSPEHKVRIVEALRASGQVVAMTGDGVNDAPAVKRADIGVAMGITGTDVAKETADMVLTDDNYVSIVSAVEQGRVIYSNIRKFVYYLLSCNIAEIAVILISTLAGVPSPLNAIQLLWLNLITDGAPALALGTEKGDPDIMLQPPRPPKEEIINRSTWTRILIQTIAISSVTLIAYSIGLRLFPVSAKTMAFITLSASELLRAYTARSERYPLLKIGLFSNRGMNVAVLSSLVLLLAVVYLPILQPIFKTVSLGFQQWQYVLPLLFVPAIVAEISKRVLARNARARVTS